MGSEEDEEPADECAVAITEETVLLSARNKGLSVRESPDGETWQISNGDKFAFFPRAFIAGGYTDDQVAFIEFAFQDCGVELFPIGNTLH